VNVSTLFARPRRSRHGGNPYPALPNAAASVTEAIAALPVEKPRPVFTPCAPGDTQPIAVVPGAHARPVRRHVPEILTLLQRTRAGLLNLGPAPATSQPAPVLVPSRPAPAPVPPSRAERFIADLRHKGGLPLFRGTAREIGWCGLHQDSWPTWTRYTTERWERQSRAVIAAQIEAARAETRQAVTEWERYENRIRTAADTAPALGYPQADL
jgi:hypothetical protein